MVSVGAGRVANAAPQLKPIPLCRSSRGANVTKGKAIELKDLVGKHTLSGVDMNSESIQSQWWGDLFEDCNVINFVLDGVTYTAIEDPGNGYRSAMREIATSEKLVSNTFAGQEVLARMRKNDRYEKHDILDLVDIVTGKVVLSVGTGNTDAYYPYWVAEFTPENMGANAAA